MSSAAPTDLSAAVIIERIAAGVLPRQAVETIARGFLPLAQEELVPVLSYVALYSDVELAALARASLADIPSRIVHGFAAQEAASPEHLELLMRASDDPAILEALVRNRSVPDEAVAELARRADGAVQEIVVINQARILRAPVILDALMENPLLTADVRRRALETREEFFEKKARIEAARVVDEDEPDLELPDDEIADLLAKAAEEDAARKQEPPPPVPESELQDPKKMSVFTRVLLMTVSEKVQLAYKGGKTERMILVRDHNRLICTAVMRNPRMNESEVESIAGMRGISEEVLRLIGMRRDWMAKYNIALTLARNPKAPVGVVLPIVNRLTLRDLKYLKDDRNVSEVVRTSARKMFIQRSQKS
jgi:hypothetical protein